MEPYRVLEIKEGIFDDNNRRAEELRQKLKAEKTFLLNLMSSPGSGKTTTLLRTIERLKDKLRIGVMEADIDSTVDAETISRTGVKTIQLHTGGMCHLDAEMTRQGLEGLGTRDIDLAILENVGNLVCPAEFSLGEDFKAMILSVAEGDDKPLKYPLMFQESKVLLINKMDLLPFCDCNPELIEERALKINPDLSLFRVSCRTGEGLDRWSDWLRRQIFQLRQSYKKSPSA